MKIHSRERQAEIDRADLHAREAVRQRRISDLYFHDAQTRLAQQALNAGQHVRTQDILDEIHPDTDGVDPRSFAWHYLSHQSRRILLRLRGDNPDVGEISLSADGATLVTSGKDGLDVWDLRSEQLRYKIRIKSRAIGSSETRSIKLGAVPEGFLVTALDAIDLESRRTIDRFQFTVGDRVEGLGLRSYCLLQARLVHPGGMQSLLVWDLVRNKLSHLIHISWSGIIIMQTFSIVHPSSTLAARAIASEISATRRFDHGSNSGRMMGASSGSRIMGIFSSSIGMDKGSS